MSYLRKINYIVKPEKSFPVLRNCAGCGGKTTFINTNNFRVNANGNKIDVWLIYQCEKCKHSANMTIYERQKPSSIDRNEYEKFLANDMDLAYQYGTNTHFFAKNRAEIDWSSIKYTVVPDNMMISNLQNPIKEGTLIEINNVYSIKVRTDKLVSEVLNITRSRLKDLVKTEALVIEEDKIEHCLRVHVVKDIDAACSSTNCTLDSKVV